MKIRTRVLILLLTLSLTPCIILSAFFYHLTYDYINDEVVRTLNSEVTRTQALILNIFERYYDRVRLVTSRSLLRTNLIAYETEHKPEQQKAIVSFINNAVEAVPGFQSIAVYDASGFLVAATELAHASEQFPYQELFDPKNLYNRIVHIVANSEHDHVASIAVPLVLNDRSIGYVIIATDLDDLKKLSLQSMGLGSTEEISIIWTGGGKGGELIFGHKFPLPDNQTVLRSQAVSPALRKVVDQQMRGVIEAVDYRGEPVLASVRYVEPLQLELVVKIDRAEAYGPLELFRVTAGIFLAALVLITVFLATVFSKSIVNPVRQLARAVRNVRSGTQQEAVKVSSVDEIAELATAFNEMNGRLQHSQSNIEAQLHQLQESEDRTKLITQASLDAIVVMNDHYEVVEWNPAAEQIFQWTRAEAVGTHVSSLIVPPRLSATFERELEEYLTTPHAKVPGRRTETIAQRKGGEEFPIELSLRSMRYGGSFLYFAYIRDISRERKAAAESVRLAAVLRDSADAIIAENLENRITAWNESAERLFGYSAEEVIGKSGLLIVPPDNAVDEATILNKVRHGERIVLFNSMRRRKDGTIFPVSISVSPMKDQNGTVAGVSIIARDMTERLQAEEYMQRSLREKEVLLKEIHHRVKNNMQVICSLLRLQAEFSGNDELQKILMESETRVRSMALVHERLYRSDRFSEIALHTYIEQLVGELQRSYPVGTNVRVEINLDPVTVALDGAVACGLILNELISNAFKHAFKGRDTGVITINLTALNEKVLLEVADNGIGIRTDFNYAKPQSLGMELIKTLTDQLRGDLEIINDHGSRFVLTFPQSLKQELSQQEKRNGTDYKGGGLSSSH